MVRFAAQVVEGLLRLVTLDPVMRTEPGDIHPDAPPAMTSNLVKPGTLFFRPLQVLPMANLKQHLGQKSSKRYEKDAKCHLSRSVIESEGKVAFLSTLLPQEPALTSVDWHFVDAKTTMTVSMFNFDKLQVKSPVLHRSAWILDRRPLIFQAQTANRATIK